MSFFSRFKCYINGELNRIDLKREVKFFYQRRIRGWDDSETFSLDHSLAKLILPRLKAYKKFSSAIIDRTGNREKDLDKMITAFEYAASDDRWENMKDCEKHQEGIDLFAKYYFGLWW